ncbi:MAG: hypothetical protein QW514_06900 [Thermoprotei archaeon]
MNRLGIILPIVAITLGSFFLYLGFESGTGGYVTLSIDGAFLVLVGLVTILAPRVNTVEVDFLEELVKPVAGAEQYIQQILSGELSAVFTRDARIVLKQAGQTLKQNGADTMIEPLSQQLRRTVEKRLASNHTNNGTLTKKYAERLKDEGVLKEISVNQHENTIAVTLFEAVIGVPLLPKYDKNTEAAVATLSSKLLSRICCLVSADIQKDTHLVEIAKTGDQITLRLEVTQN